MACTASASRWSTRCASALEVDIKRDGYRWSQSFDLRRPDGPLQRHEATDETGTTTRFWASRGHLRDHRLHLRDDRQPLPRDGVPQQGPRDRRARRARSGRPRSPRRSRTPPSPTRSTRPPPPTRTRPPTGGLERTFQFDRGLVDYVEHLNKRRDTAHPTVISFEAEAAVDSTPG